MNIKNAHHLSEEVAFVELFLGQVPEKGEFWAILRIPPYNIGDYLAAAQKGCTLNLHEYGDVLKSGWGSEVSEDVCETLIQYNLHLDLGEKLSAYLDRLPSPCRLHKNEEQQ